MDLKVKIQIDSIEEEIQTQSVCQGSVEKTCKNRLYALHRKCNDTRKETSFLLAAIINYRYLFIQ